MFSESAATILTLRWGCWHIRSERHPCHNSRPFPPNAVIHGLTVHLKTVLARVHMVVCLCLGLEREDASSLLARVDLGLVPDALTHASPVCSLTKWLYHPYSSISLWCNSKTAIRDEASRADVVRFPHTDATLLILEIVQHTNAWYLAIFVSFPGRVHLNDRCSAPFDTSMGF